MLTCHNDVIDAGHNNRLFAPGTDMDRERLRLSHTQNGTDNVQICDKIVYQTRMHPYAQVLRRGTNILRDVMVVGFA